MNWRGAKSGCSGTLLKFMIISSPGNINSLDGANKWLLGWRKVGWFKERYKRVRLQDVVMATYYLYILYLYQCSKLNNIYNCPMKALLPNDPVTSHLFGYIGFRLLHVVSFVVVCRLLSGCSTWATELVCSVVVALCSSWDLRSLTRNWTHVPCIGRWILFFFFGRWILNHWTTREVPPLTSLTILFLLFTFFLLFNLTYLTVVQRIDSVFSTINLPCGFEKGMWPFETKYS